MTSLFFISVKGTTATVIDFTLSRLRAPQCIVFNDLGQDPSLFESQGDYQFEIYRMMKNATGYYFVDLLFLEFQSDSITSLLIYGHTLQ